MVRSTLHKLKWLERIATDCTLRGGEHRVAILLAGYCNLKTGRCFPAQKTLAQRLKLSVRQTNTLVRNLKRRNYIKLLKRGNNEAGSNQYQLNFELIDNDPDIKKYSSIKQEKLQSKYRKYTSYETNKETIYKTKEDEERELLGKVSFVKKGIHLQSISQVDLQEMLQRGLITEEEYKKW